jgi:hypothetical protein
MEGPGALRGATPARIIPPPRLAHHVGDGNKRAARERMRTRDFESVPDNHDVNDAIDIYRFAGSWRYVMPK